MELDVYGAMLNRLRTYRKSVGINQEEMAKMLGTTQENYSYLEKGRTRLSCEALNILSKNGFDIDYLISGKKYEEAAEVNEIDRVLAGTTADTKRAVVRMLAIAMLEKESQGQAPDMSKNERCMLRAASETNDEISMPLLVRELNGDSQRDMSKNLGLCIKKYRKIEREDKYPDVEVFAALYAMSGFRPKLFMMNQDRHIEAVKTAWMRFSEEDRASLLNLAKNAIKALQ